MHLRTRVATRRVCAVLLALAGLGLAGCSAPSRTGGEAGEASGREAGEGSASAPAERRAR
jgi:hypothetical protein